MAFTAPPTACKIQFSLSINISDTNTCSPGLPATNIPKALGNLSLLHHPFGGQKNLQLLIFVLNVLSSLKLAETSSENTQHTESLRPEHPEINLLTKSGKSITCPGQSWIKKILLKSTEFGTRTPGCKHNLTKKQLGRNIRWLLYLLPGRTN